MDEFDNALMEALNEAVPPADLATDLASRLVSRTRRRTRFRKLLLVLGMFSAVTAASVVTVTTLSTGTTYVSSVVTGGGSAPSPTTTSYQLPTPNTQLPAANTQHPTTNYQLPTPNTQLPTLNSQQGATTVQSITLKKAAALTGAIALAAATPTRANGYQFIVSGYPAANPSHSDVSSGTSLGVGVLGDVSASAALEARARTCDDSAGTELRSDEFKAMVIIFR